MWATGLAVFISCLGLLGLVIYTTNRRTKEIGVRKVLGASVPQIVPMISKEFLMLIVIAFVIAAPLAWLGMNKWLENFAYRTEISWWVFVLGISVMIIIALFTLGFQTIKAAMANPVKSLRRNRMKVGITAMRNFWCSKAFSTICVLGWNKRRMLPIELNQFAFKVGYLLLVHSKKQLTLINFPRIFS